ncbi:GNAT family N-acetyltransferase [Mesorhizobium amorphae]|uniref:GNAT family N-acetyltransferase n=1 Tax=Mesorhizobium amorphae TaxID=71433 RepID=UPI001185C3B5|nr:GNAT family N-acetyltransferase [Mesorhizobium amorphae]
MSVVVRPVRPEDARGALEVHHAAVRITAASDYPAEVVENWAQMPITEKAVAGFNANPEGELRFVADLHGKIVGFAAIVARKDELRACYVAPSVARQGVGRALVKQIEQAARERGLKELHLHSSVTAHAFYTAMGYETLGSGEHVLGSGLGMRCVFMRKTL